MQVTDAVLNGTVPYTPYPYKVGADGDIHNMTLEQYVRRMAGSRHNDEWKGEWADEFTIIATALVVKCNIVLINRQPSLKPEGHALHPLGQVNAQGPRDGIFDANLPSILLWHTGGYDEAHTNPAGVYESAGTRNKFDRVHFQLLGVCLDDDLGVITWCQPPMSAKDLQDVLINVATGLSYECDDANIMSASKYHHGVLHVPRHCMLFTPTGQFCRLQVVCCCRLRLMLQACS